MKSDRLVQIKEWWDFNSTRPQIAPEGLEDVVWLVGEVERLREEKEEEVCRLEAEVERLQAEIDRLEKSANNLLKAIDIASFKAVP